MKGLIAAVSAELYRVRRSRALKLCGFLIAAVSALRVFGAHVAVRAAWAQRVQEAVLAGREVPERPGPDNAYGPWVDGWRAGLTVGALVLLVAAARSLAGDDERGLARIQTTRGISRSQNVLGRALLAPLWTVLCVAVSGLSSWLMASLLFEFGPLVQDGFELASRESLDAELRTAMLAVLPPLLCTFAFGLLISSVARTQASALLTALFCSFGFDLFKEVLGDRQYWFFAAYAPSLVDGSIMKEMSGVARGFFDAGYPPALVRMNFLVPSLEALLFLVLTLLVFRRRSL